MTWHFAAKLNEVALGAVRGVVIAGQECAIYNIDGRIYATSDICSHAFAFLSEGELDGDCIECPLHQALFHVPTGEARSAPASAPVATYDVKVEGDAIYLDLPDA